MIESDLLGKPMNGQTEVVYEEPDFQQQIPKIKIPEIELKECPAYGIL